MTDFELWLEKNNTIKSYAHFDRRISIKSVLSDIENPEKIAKHSFMPFIHYELKFQKYSKTSGRSTKIRQLYYSSHYDRCIYQYYAYLLNNHYNQTAKQSSINDVAIAYRNNLKKNNIHFAKEAFDFIRGQENCVIIVGDFKDFFDTLEHAYLKKQICSILRITTLPKDYYQVFKSITKFSYVDLIDIFNHYDLTDTEENRRLLNNKPVILPIQQLRANKSMIKQNPHPYGIPQGSAISAILSNIYMLEFDKQINNYVKSIGGKYLRYSDDTIFILPIKSFSDIQPIYQFITHTISSIPNLTMQPSKTKVYTYSSEHLKNCDSIIGNACDGKNIIDYLGFSFDGKTITIRDKTLSKYYYRTYKKARTIKIRNGVSPLGNKISCKNLYKTYSLKGYKIGQGNFLTYVKKCKKIFGPTERVHIVINKHFGKIKKHLK